MELIAGAAIGAVIVWLYMMKQANDQAAQPMPTQPNALMAGTGGAAVQMIQTQPSSNPSEAATGPISFSAPINMAPRPPVRFPVNTAPVPVVGFGTRTPPAPPSSIGFNYNNTAITGKGTAPKRAPAQTVRFYTT